MSDDDMLKVVVARAITRIVNAGNYTQSAAAEIMKIDQPKVSKLLRGRLKEFSSKWLIERLLLLGYDMEINFSKASRQRGRIKAAA
jgi:predicted XRE-type DNA-binding protein